MVYESNDMRVWHLHLSPGKTIPPHRHDRPYFWTVLTDGQGRSRYDDGRDITTTYKTGDTRHFPGLTTKSSFVHDLTNTGDTSLLFVTAEFTTHPGDNK